MRVTPISSFSIRALSWVFCLTLLLAPPLLAQETAGSIEGTVADASGALIPNAAVKIEGTAFNRTATTNSEGFYRMLQVPPGTYKVSVSATSFSTATVEGVIVALGKASAIDLTLKVGAVTEQVVVTGNDLARIDPTDNKIQMSLRYIYKNEMALLLRAAGFARFEIYGDFDRRPLTREDDAMIVEAWKD